MTAERALVQSRPEALPPTSHTHAYGSTYIPRPAPFELQKAAIFRACGRSKDGAEGQS